MQIRNCLLCCKPVEEVNEMHNECVFQQRDKLRDEVKSLKNCRSCLMSGPGRGDCEHFVGWPKEEKYPETVDEYGIPHGWCIACYRAHEIERLRAELDEAKSQLRKIKDMAVKQAEDEGLWFVNASAPEAYLQQELRSLHTLIEKNTTSKRSNDE